MPMQGTQADLVKLAMIEIAPNLPDNANIILQIHDELIVECKKDDGPKVAKILQQKMEKIHKFAVPISVNTSIGQTWDDID